MKARAWQQFLNEQRTEHDKVLFTVTELANISGVSQSAVNVEMSRLRRQGLVVRYAHGLYGLPGAVTPEALLPCVDSHAYLTGGYALFVHNLIVQSPASITCFTDRYNPRASERNTPVGRFVFVCVRSRVYAPPTRGVLASPAQALCDYVYMTRRSGLVLEGLVTFRNLAAATGGLHSVLSRYPMTVQRAVLRLVK